MPTLPDAIEQFLGRFLRGMMEQNGSLGFDKPMEDMLAEMEGLPGVAGALLVSASPEGKPQHALCSSAWDQKELQDQERLRDLAEHLKAARANGTTLHGRRAVDETPLGWLASCLRNQEASTFVMVPLCHYVPTELVDVGRFRRTLIVAFATGTRPTPNALETLEFLAWLMAQLMVNDECPRLQGRYHALAHAIRNGVSEILAALALPKPARDQLESGFGPLVQRIRELMVCDTCQLYLLPQYSSRLAASRADQVWLVAEDFADRHGLRYAYSDESLVSLVWKRKENTPLRVNNMLFDPQHRQYALGKFGLTRHVLAMRLVIDAPEYETLGVLVLRDKYEKGDDGYEQLAEKGFPEDDEERIVKRAYSADGLVSWLSSLKGRLDAGGSREQVVAALNQMRESICADTGLLFVPPQVWGKEKEGSGAYMDMYCHSRQHWILHAHYSKGDGLTGRAFNGEAINIPDVLLMLTESAKGNGTPVLGKYRLSQHVLAVPITGPSLLGGGAASVIGVLKVRDRLVASTRTSGAVALSAQPFSDEDRELLVAFANMISVSMSLREYLREKLAGKDAGLMEIMGGIAHDYVAEGGGMALRSYWGTRMAVEDVKWGPMQVCNLTAALGELLPRDGGVLNAYEGCGADVSIRAEGISGGSLRVQCDRWLIEVAVLALPVYLWHVVRQGGGALRGDVPVAIAVACDQGWVTVCISTGRFGKQASDWELTAPVMERNLVHFTRKILCPLIPLRRFRDGFAHFGGKLTTSSEDSEHRIEISLKVVEAQS